MEILVALGGAIIGALVSVTLTHLYSDRSEQNRVRLALRTELKINAEIAVRILKSNQKGDLNSSKWYEFIPFMETAWASFVAQGILSKLKQPESEKLSRAYALIRSANFQAKKIQMGTFKPLDTEKYSERVTEAEKGILSALESLST